MSNSASLEDKFQAAVKAIQRLPNDGESSREIKFLNNSFVFFYCRRNFSTVEWIEIDLLWTLQTSNSWTVQRATAFDFQLCQSSEMVFFEN